MPLLRREGDPAALGIADLGAPDFGDPVEAVNRVAAQLTDGDASNGEADVIVALYHEGAGAGTPDGATLEEAVADAYEVIGGIELPGSFYRKDIARPAIEGAISL